MSIIKRPYEISVWEDIYTGTQREIEYNYESEDLSMPEDDEYHLGTYLEERKIAIIGSDKMTSLARVCEPQLNLDIKGKTTLSFYMYRKYYDNITGQLVENPFNQYIQNERKIKLYYDDGVSEDKWRDFIITSISPETTNYKISVVATDLSVVELSKIGFNKTFNSELQNNTDTISNLARTALDGTVWSLDENTEEIKQFQTDTLVKIKLKRNINFILYDNDEHPEEIYPKEISFDRDSFVYCFYSQLTRPLSNIKEISFIFLKDGENNSKWYTKEATNKDYIDNVLFNNYFGVVPISNNENWIQFENLNIPYDYFVVDQITPTIDEVEIMHIKKGKRLIQNQKSHYDEILNRYVKEYIKTNVKKDRLVKCKTTNNDTRKAIGSLIKTNDHPLEQEIILDNNQNIFYCFLDELKNKGDSNGYVHFFFVPENDINSNPITTKEINSESDLKEGYLCIYKEKTDEIVWITKEGVKEGEEDVTLYLPYSFCWNYNSDSIVITNYSTMVESDLIYGYEDLEYEVAPLVQNLIPNGDKKTDLDGWYTSSEAQLREIQLKLGTTRFDQDPFKIRKNYIPFTYIQFGTRVNADNIKNVDNVAFELPRNTRLTNFILNNAIQDNLKVINNIQKNDRFRIQINVERNTLTDTSGSLNVLQGFKPYIIRLPQNRNSTDAMEEVIWLECNQNNSLKQDSDTQITITKNPVIINFSYIPQKYRMFDYDNVFYYKKSSSLRREDLAPLGESTLIPIRMRINNELTDPIFYMPYWRLYKLYQAGYIANHYQNADFSEDGYYDGSSEGFYLTNRRSDAVDLTCGYDQFLRYWSGMTSVFKPLDFCIIADLTIFLEAYRYFSYNYLRIKENITADTLLNIYYVMFTDIEENEERFFAKPSWSDVNEWETKFQDVTNYRETYYADTFGPPDYKTYIRGYFGINDNKERIFISERINDNLSLSGSVEIEDSSGEIVTTSWQGIQVDRTSSDNDLNNILRVRNVWKITHYEPFNHVKSDYDIPYAYCTFETEGTYYGIIEKTVGERLRKTDSPFPSNIDDTIFNTIVYKNKTTLTQEDLSEQECVLLFSNYGNYGTDLDLTGNSYYSLSLSHIIFTRYFLDKNGKVVTPDSIPSASTRTIYRYFDSNYGLGNKNLVSKPEDIIYQYTGYTACNDYEPLINLEGIAYNSITTTESNVFNILQKLCEIFGCWLKINLKHDENGRLILNNQKPEGKISFHKYIGDNLSYGFKTGLNINTIQRTDITDDIVTKMIVKQNNNEFGNNKICTITRSIYNILGGNDLYNFDYYINQGILEKDIYDVLYMTYGKPLNKIREKTIEYENDLRQLSVEISQLKSEQDYYKTQYDSATEKITVAKKNFESLTGKSYNYYLQNKKEMDGLWSKDGLISLYEEYKEQIDYYTGMRKMSYPYWVKMKEEYDNKYEEYVKKNKLISILAAHRSKIMEEFYNIYHTYIREGSWISEDYLDDNKYFFAASDVLNTSAQPKITYSFNVVDIGALEEFKGYNFKLGDKTFVEDPEFFGYEEDGITPYKEEVTISGMQINLDSPEKNTITVQNYRTQFQDLFQRIAATVQAVEYHTGNYRNTKTERP